MAGKTGLVIGFLHERFIHVPIELLVTHTKRLDPASGWRRSVLLLQDRRQNSIEQGSRKKAIMDKETTYQVTGHTT